MSELINERIKVQEIRECLRSLGSQSDAAIKAPKKNLSITISNIENGFIVSGTYDDPVNYAATKRGIEKVLLKRVRDFFAQLEG